MWLKRIYAKLNKKYRIAFIDHESLSQSRMFIIKPLTSLIFFLVFTSMVIAGTACLVIFTPPIRNRIPGCINPELEADFRMTKDSLIMLSRQFIEMDSILSSLSRVYDLDKDNSGSGVAMNSPVEQNAPNTYDYSSSESVTPVEKSPVYQENQIKPVSLASAGANILNLVSPLSGDLTSRFNPEDKHFGIDIVAKENSIIKSVADGFVIFSEYSTQTGYVIGISHGNLVSFYKHNSRIFKDVGSYVFAGEAIAVIGNTGENTSGTHLHFELWNQGKPVNPEDYVFIN